MYKVIFLSCLTLGFISCSSDTIKEKINKAGNIAGQATGEFVEGASKGISKAFDVKISIDPALEAKGIQFGKTTVTNDSLGTDNLLVAYVIFNSDYSGKLTAKAFDEHGMEMGRASVMVTGKKDEATYVDFHFDKRTNIDSKNKLTVE